MNFFAQAVLTFVAGWLLTGVGDLYISLPGIFTQPWWGPSMFSWRAMAVALDQTLLILGILAASG